LKLSHFIGNTPIIELERHLLLKAEIFNPTGSIKDRPAFRIIEDAEKRRLLSPGDTLIEATSGNMGISLAWIAAERGYRMQIVMPSNMSEERKKTLELYGANLIEVDPGDFDGAIRLRDELAQKNGWFNCNQFANPLNILAHRETTALEIIQYCELNQIVPSTFITGTGTGGTLMGAGLKLREQYPDLEIIAIEPAESPVMSGGSPGLHGIQGIGDGSKFLVDLNYVSRVITVPTEKAKEEARLLAKNFGLFVGISSGANVWAAKKVMEKSPGPIITFLCDRGERYFSCL
jgi:cysteine synthase A